MTPLLVKYPLPGQWLRFGDDGWVDIHSGKVEIGQALDAALAGWVAHELGWPVSQVRVAAPATDASPDAGVTSGSLSMQDSGRTLAGVARVVRRRLTMDAASRWGMDARAIRFSDGVLCGQSHSRQERITLEQARAALAEPVSAAEWDAAQPPRTDPGTGEGVGALDHACLAARRALLARPLRLGGHFIHDLRFPGMLHGRVLHGRAGHADASPRPVADDLLEKVRAMPGVCGVIFDGALTGVLADGAGRAERAARQLLDTHRLADEEDERLRPRSRRPDPCDPSSWAGHAGPARIVALHPPHAEGHAVSADDLRLVGLDVPPGGRAVQAEFTRGWLAHASIGPSCALARWSLDGRSLEVWTHSQSIFNLRRDLALAWGVDEQAVRVRHAPGAGCYGHNGADDVAFDASWLARSVCGRVVCVEWLREQEWRSAPLGPAMRVALQAALDSDGRIVEWRHEIWSPGHSSRPGRSATPSLLGNALRADGAPLPAAIDMPLASGGGAERNAVPGYDWPAWQVLAHRVTTSWRSSALRSLGAHLNVYAVENLLDEVARSAGRCPWAIRLEALSHDARGCAVLRLARIRSDWDVRHEALRHVEGAGLGLAYARYKNTGAWCAVVAEVRAEAQLRVLRLTIVADVGRPVHRQGVLQQLEGGAVQAVSWTLHESVSADAQGAVAPGEWTDYPILGFGNVPDIDVHLVETSEPPIGAGEAACGPVAAAIGNALFDAMDVRVRDLPLTAQRIVSAMDV
jgi:nicotinate dehydrogenase subunit B